MCAPPLRGCTRRGDRPPPRTPLCQKTNLMFIYLETFLVNKMLKTQTKIMFLILHHQIAKILGIED